MQAFKFFAWCLALTVLGICLWPAVIVALIIRLIMQYRKGVHAERVRHVVAYVQQPRITYQ